MRVLARHAARLGQSAKEFEKVLTRWGTGCWAFLADPKGQTAYSDIKQQFAQIYDQRCRYPLKASILSAGPRRERPGIEKSTVFN